MILSEPQFVDVLEMTVAGFRQEYTREQMMEIPAQWERFNSSLAESGIPYGETYGVIYPASPMIYVTGIEIAPDLALPEGWDVVEVAAQHYAVFAQTGGIPAIREAWPAIWTDWLPKSGKKLAAGAAMVEKYPGDWVSSGDFEIWIPLAG